MILAARFLSLRWRFVGLLGIFFVVPVAGDAVASLNIDIHYIEQQIVHPPVLSNQVAWPVDEGLRGAELGISDNNTTGRFLQHEYRLHSTIVPADEDVVAAARKQLAQGAVLAIVNVPAAVLVQIADLPEAQDDLLFNARSMSRSLRAAECRSNVLHTMASRAMLSDALMQFFASRRWSQLFFIVGNRSGDKLFADSLRNSAVKFGLKIVKENSWIANSDMRRNASREVPQFTRARKYDVVVVADESSDFSPYINYNTWLPRPVAGSTGLQPVVWSGVVEQWGAAQLQSRFQDLASRSMTSVDYANWAAVRAIGEAVTRTTLVAPSDLRGYLLSEAFSLSGFKGAGLDFRQWNGQMRQPIPLVSDKSVVASAPLEGYLHAHTELDTLGLDEPESHCKSFVAR